MVGLRVYNASRGTRRGHSYPLITLLALLITLALPVKAQKSCSAYNCNEICDSYSSSGIYMPQICDECCHNTNNNEDDADNDGDVSERLEVLEAQIKELRILVGVILALVVLLILGAIVAIFRRNSARAIKAALPVLFRSKDEGRASIEKKAPPCVKELPTKMPNPNRNSTVVRIADYQNNHSPLSKRMQRNGQVVREDSKSEADLSPPSNQQRTRQPSESTLPDDSVDSPQGHQHAYDNLAMTSSPSSSTLGPAVSTNTLDTTLASVNHTSVIGSVV